MAVRFEMFHVKSVLKGQSERGMLEENEKKKIGIQEDISKIIFIWASAL